MSTSNIENKISKDRNILIVLQENIELNSELHYLTENFCGSVVKNLSEIQTSLSDKRIYVCGDIDQLKEENQTFFVIKELSVNYENHIGENIQLVTLGKVPILVSNAGIYFRDMFDNGDYFKIGRAHV